MAGDYPRGRDSALKVLKVGECFILGEIALQKDNWGTATAFLEEAAEFEDVDCYWKWLELALFGGTMKH